ncbi:MAG: cytochrome P450 [Jatrophihabitantaceae bacterium]
MTVTEEQIRDYPFEPFRGELPAELLDMVHTRPVSKVRIPDGRVVWLVLGYPETTLVLSDPRFARHNADIGPGESSHGCPVDSAEANGTPQPQESPAETGQSEAGQCPAGQRQLSMDGKPHHDLRRLAARAFTARRIEAYRPRVQAITDELIDALMAAGPPGDLVSGLVVPLPVIVTCELLSIPVADRDQVAVWSNDIMSLTAHGQAGAARAETELRAYLLWRLTARRDEPGEDLLSSWLATQVGSDLSDVEIAGLAIGVLIGGREISSTSAGIRALFQHPTALRRLREDPSLLPAAVEEILRYTSVSPMFLVQTVTEDVELGGQSLRAGDGVMAVPWAANRHGAAFAEPDRFDLDRTPQNPHLTFGFGPHFCLGAALGRLQVEIAIGTLLRRMPELAPATGLQDLPWRDERINCGLAEFPVTW